jgi:DNA polymerase elongation subunit (family B)
MEKDTSPIPLEKETLTVHAYDWKIRDEFDDDGHCVIHAWCLDRNSNSYLLRFHDFPAFCHVELPMFVNQYRIEWSEYKAQQVFNTLSAILKSDAPYKHFYKTSKKLYYFRNGRKYPMMVLMFDTVKSMEKCRAILENPITVRDIGKIACRVWETKIPLVRKFLSLRNTNYSQWFTINARKVFDEEKISTIENEYIGDRKTLNPIDPNETKSWVTHPRILSFDIECYSSNPNSLPNRYLSKDVAFGVSCVYQQSGYPETREKHAIIYGDVDVSVMEGITVTKVRDEMDLIDKMSDLIVKYDPEIISGYNIFGFDYPYLNERLSKRGKEWKPISRIYNDHVKLTSISWGSSGYGHNDINFLDMEGRISIDMYPIFRRDYKLQLYNLDFVSKAFLGKGNGKHDVNYKDIFKAYDNQQKVWKHLVSTLTSITESVTLDDDRGKDEKGIKLWSKFELTFDKIDIDEINRWFQDITEDQTNKLIGYDRENVERAIHDYNEARNEMTRIMRYCDQDALLCIDLFDKISCWIGLIEMSNIVGVTLVELFTRGQQLRVLSQVYDFASKLGFIIDERIIPRMEYAGGFVYDPIPGLYHYIPCLDFKSLYPSVMRAYNICYTTFIPPELMDKIPDELCHVFDWYEDIEDEGDEDDPEIDENNKPKSKRVHFRYKFIKSPPGILPQILERMGNERDAVKKLIEVEKDPTTLVVLDKRQLGLKVSMNSVSGNTPIPCLIDGKFEYRNIEELAEKNSWVIDEDQNQVSVPKNIKVWSDVGWTDIKFVIRHPVREPLKRVLTHTACIDCTDGHSLLRPNGDEVKPTDLNIGDELMHRSLPLPNDMPDEPMRFSLKVESSLCYAYGRLYSQIHNEECEMIGLFHTSRGEAIISNKVFQMNLNDRLNFFTGYYDDNFKIHKEKNCIVTSSSILLAQLNYLIESLSYHTSISIDNENYKLNFSESELLNDKILSMTAIKFNKDEYIYDLETENHHFAAGIGNMIVHNSMYGALGAQNGGKLPLVEAAACVTSKSRDSIKLVNSYLESKGKRIVYGDSVTGDIPILCRDGSQIFYRPISQLYDEKNWIFRGGKEYLQHDKNLEVWSDKGFTRIKHVMRHKTNKRIYRIITSNGIIKATEDHSLLNSKGEEIRPNQVNVGYRLMSKKLPELDGDILHKYANMIGKNTRMIIDNKLGSQQELYVIMDNVLKLNHESRLQFYYGYIGLNGDTNNDFYTTENGYLASVIYHLSKSLNWSVICDFKNNEYSLRIYRTNKFISVLNTDGVIKRIENLGFIDDYVYDLETENHHFAAGVGELIVHNTDSSMPDLGITNPKTAYDEAKQWAKDISALFPPPMEVELDWMAHTMFNICKKKYAYIKMDKKGDPIMDPDNIGTKGIALARRDNCPFQRQLMRRVLWNVLTKKPMKETLEIIVDDCIKLMSGCVPWRDLIMIKGLGSNYKSPSYFMKIFGDELSRIGKPANPGDRLEYLIVTSKGVEGKQLLGYKMRLPITYLERLKSDEAEKIDYIYYIEKILKNCIEQIFKVGFQDQIAILEAKYLDMDQCKVFKTLRDRGYGPALDQLMMQNNHDKSIVIDILLDSEIGKIVKQLKSCYISKRGKFISRITKEPIKILLKIILQKMELTNYIKTLVPVAEIPKLTQIKLKIVQDQTQLVSQQQQWINKNVPQPQLSPIKLNISRPEVQPSPIKLNISRPQSQPQPSPIKLNISRPEPQPSPIKLNISRPQSSPIGLNIPTIKIPTLSNQNQTLVLPVSKVLGNQTQFPTI